MARQNATLTVIPVALANALQLVLSLTPKSEGQIDAQREIVASLQRALDVRRQRIILSQSRVNWIKWTGMIALAMLILLAIAFVHSGNRATAAIAMAVFASAIAVTLLLIASQDRPFSGPFGVKPSVLEQVRPGAQ